MEGERARLECKLVQTRFKLFIKSTNNPSLNLQNKGKVIIPFFTCTVGSENPLIQTAYFADVCLISEDSIKYSAVCQFITDI